MKEMLRDYMGLEQTASAKQKAPSSKKASKLYLSESGICAAEAGSFLDADAAKILPSGSLNAPFLLFFALLILPWALYRYLQQRKPSFAHIQFTQPPATVPIYLKLGQLVYYA